MKPEALYHHLKEFAERLDIQVTEHNLRNIGMRVASGLCKVRGENRFIMDKHLSIHLKNRILAAHLGRMAGDGVYVLPAVREYIEKQRQRGGGGE